MKLYTDDHRLISNNDGKLIIHDCNNYHERTITFSELALGRKEFSDGKISRNTNRLEKTYLTSDPICIKGKNYLFTFTRLKNEKQDHQDIVTVEQKGETRYYYHLHTLQFQKGDSIIFNLTKSLKIYTPNSAAKYAVNELIKKYELTSYPTQLNKLFNPTKHVHIAEFQIFLFKVLLKSVVI